MWLPFILMSTGMGIITTASPLIKRDFTSNGILYVEITSTEYLTTTVQPTATLPLIPQTKAPQLFQTSTAVTSESISTAPTSSTKLKGVEVNPYTPPVQPPASTSAIGPANKPVAAVAAVAAVVPPAASTSVDSANTPGVPTTQQVLAVAPSSNSCSGATYADECITADQAAPAIANSYSKYGINSPAAQAAVLALMAFESGDFKYNKKHFPAPVPGQGTRNMMSPSYVHEYATDVYGADKAASAGSDAAVLALVNDVEDSCGSGAWFLKTKCPNVLAQFATDAQGAWNAYLGSGCIGTTITDERNAGFANALKAFGVSS